VQQILNAPGTHNDTTSSIISSMRIYGSILKHNIHKHNKSINNSAPGLIIWPSLI